MADKYELHEDIIHNIFLRMPTKPLLRLKCLSKHWNRVISDENFMKLRSRRMIIPPVLPLHAIDYNAPGDDMGHSMIKLHLPFETSNENKVRIVGSIDGIVLLVIKKRLADGDADVLILYNPFTTAFKIVSHPQSPSVYVYGFGYGTVRDDLKIVRIETDYYGSGSKYYDVFSLKKGSWSRRQLDLIGNYCFSLVSGTFVNGFLYWIQWSMPSIVAFDLKEMVFSEIVLPSGFYSYRLGTFKGCLCMFWFNSDGVEYELKVMNEHSFFKSWSTICSSNFNSLSGHFNGFSMMDILDEGKLLLLMTFPSNQRMIIYDMVKDSCREVNNVTSFCQVEVLHSVEYLTGSVEYVESSISPSHMCSISI